MTVAGGVSKEDFDAAVRAVSDVVSAFCPGSPPRTAERTYQAWKSEPALICEIEIGRGRTPYRGIVPESAGWGEARKYALEDLFRRGGWPRAFSGEEMRLKLSLLSENELHDKCRRYGGNTIRRGKRHDETGKRKNKKTIDASPVRLRGDFLETGSTGPKATVKTAY